MPVPGLHRACARGARTLPHMVLLGVGMRWKEALRVARQIKTEAGEPPRVGLLDPRGRIPNAKDVLNEGMADGVFQSNITKGFL